MIRCFQPHFFGKEIENIKNCLESGILACGPLVKEFEKKFEEISKKKYNVGFNNGSAAAFAIFTYLKLKYGSCDVYAPSLSFSSPVWAAMECEHATKYVDISTKNFAISQETLEETYSKYSKDKRRKIVFPCLYGGISRLDIRKNDEDSIMVVDASHTVNPDMDSDFIFFSFHPVKPICMGNGGMVSTDDKEAFEFLMRYRNFGRAKVDYSYDVIQTGFNFYMNDLNAAIGLGQLGCYLGNLNVRKSITEFYNKNIDAEKYQIVDHIDSNGNSSYYFYTIILKRGKNINKLIEYMKTKKIETLVHYPLIHKLSFFKPEEEITLKNSEDVEGRFINIPCHASMKLDDAKIVMEALNNFSGG